MQFIVALRCYLKIIVLFLIVKKLVINRLMTTVTSCGNKTALCVYLPKLTTRRMKNENCCRVTVVE